MFRIKQVVPPLARWGVAGGSIVFFLLFEEFPQLILQTQYGIFPGYKDVLVSFGLMSQNKANAIDRALPLAPGVMNRATPGPPENVPVEE